MLFVRTLVWCFVVLMLFSAGLASGQAYPNKPVRIVTGAAGGGDDFIARQIAQGITIPLGQPVIVDNRANVVSIEVVMKAPPDGYTLLLSASSIWLAPLLRDNVPWDAVRDFAPITLAESSPNVLVVHPAVAAKSVNELVGLAKAKPGELNYSTGAAGGTAHLAGELFKAMAGVNIVRIPYKSGGLAVNALLAGEVQVTFAGAGALAAHLKSGRLRALAVTSSEPSTLFPGVPAVAATVPGYQAASFTVVLAPAKTPAAIVKRLNQETVRLLRQPEVREQLLKDGVQAVGSSPEELAAIINTEIAKWSKLIKDVGIRAD